MAAGTKHAFERAQEEQDVSQRRSRTHEANAPDFSSERAEAGANLDSKFVEQPAAQLGFIDTIRHPYGVQRPQALRHRRQQRQSEGIEAGHERLVMTAVSLPSRLQAFLLDNRKRLVKSVDERSRDGVMVFSPQPEVLEQRQVQIEAPGRRAVLERSTRKGNGSKAGGCAKPFL